MNGKTYVNLQMKNLITRWVTNELMATLSFPGWCHTEKLQRIYEET